MLNLIYMLTALEIYCKDAHYNFKGIDFKPLHEWMDEIIEPLYDLVDEAKEKFYLAKELPVPRGTEINDEAKNYVPDTNGNNEYILNNLLALISMAHNTIQTIDIKDAGINDLLGRIDTHLLHHIALLNLALEKDK